MPIISLTLIIWNYSGRVSMLGMRTDLTVPTWLEADLAGFPLAGSDMSSADLANANLSEADLSRALTYPVLT